MPKVDCSYDPGIVTQAVSAANAAGRPLYIVVLATKPCYIKLASLVYALREQSLPFLLIDANQHYQSNLTHAREELAYLSMIGVHLNIRGGLLERTADLAHKIEWLVNKLHAGGLRLPPVPVVSGDTSTAALLPPLWYLLTGILSVHVEAGLRSHGPEIGWEWRDLTYLISQRDVPWRRFRDDPFPEGIDTTLASVASDLFFAPVQRNFDNLVAEGYERNKIHIVGSLSADAVRLALSLEMRPPVLSNGKWLRVDIHRRENTTPERLNAILQGLARFSESGGKVLLIRTNALDAALKQRGEFDLLETLERRAGVLIQSLWPSYLDVISFINSENCLGVFTDSGGLQEEAAVLRVPCITCRYSTDRPETVLDSHSNILLAPESPQLVKNGLESIFASAHSRVWPEAAAGDLYGERVAHRMVRILSEYEPPPPAKGAEVVFTTA
jgi:UDP-N-acetylglucosamine 2-epimerase